MVWGFLPCGLVYSMLALASVAGGPADGALVMLAFGAGTLPALFAAGLAASRLRVLAQSAVLRRSAAAAYIALGVWFAFTALSGPAGHHGHAGHDSSVGDGGAGENGGEAGGGGGAGGDTCPPRVSAL
jgi:sulfite exporter TauE/SafE